MLQSKSKIFGGAVWSMVHRFGMVVVAFVSNIVLARLLTPSDYGCIGMLMIFISLANTFIDGGFGSALIQKKDPTQEDYSTIFYWNLFLSVLLYLVLFLFAPLIAKFYNLDLLSSVLRVQGLVLIINSLSIIPQNILRKRLLFKQMALVTLLSSVLSLSIAIYFALQGYGVWALVIQQLSLSALNAIFYCLCNIWRPKFVFSVESFKSLFNFGGYILLSNLLITFANNVQGIIIGRLFTPAVMGLYAQAKRLEEVASTTFSTVVDQVSYPILSEVQEDKTKIVDILRKLSIVSAYVCFPIMILLIVIAKPLIIFLYSDKWIECVPYFRILCVAGLVMCIYNLNYFAVAALGKSKILFKLTIVKRVLSIIFMLIGVYMNGVYGLLWGMVLGFYCIYFINALLSSYMVGYKLKRQMLDLLPIISLSLFVGLVVWYGGSLVAVHEYLLFFIQTIVYLLLYIFISCIFKLESLLLLKKMVVQFIKK